MFFSIRFSCSSSLTSLLWNTTFWLWIMALMSGSPASFMTMSGTLKLFSPCASARRRVTMVSRRRRRSCNMRSLASAVVLSSVSSTSPSLTVSPSLTIMSLMMPPSRCWTTLLLPVATKLPWAMMAEESGAVPAQYPKPPKEASRTASPMELCSRIERGTSLYHSSWPCGLTSAMAFFFLNMTILNPRSAGTGWPDGRCPKVPSAPLSSRRTWRRSRPSAP
ncbi:hypothetical protein D3C80_1068960 [compost metagenome]